ncbi:unnamed protein product [Arabidopsis lyrata]|nr:unnamed protein product [Arabidopsis lyrata]
MFEVGGSRSDAIRSPMALSISLINALDVLKPCVLDQSGFSFLCSKRLVSSDHMVKVYGQAKKRWSLDSSLSPQNPHGLNTPQARMRTPVESLQDFRNRQLNFAASSAPSRLLITFYDFLGKVILLFSLPYPNVSSSSPPSRLVRYKDLSLFKLHGRKVYNAVRGLICIGSKRKVGICNPSTRRLHVLPQIKHKDPPINLDVDPRCNYFLGYDLVGDQYKILAVDNWRWSLEQKVVVLGGERVWRKAPCAKCPHVSRTPALYMDGTLYYGANRRGMNNISIIVSFDVRLETLKSIKIPVIL